jgi:3-deoxy-D-manno-octulosonic acid kinase
MMRGAARPGSLPDGFVIRHRPGRRLLVRESAEIELARAGYGLDGGGRASDLSGRTPLLELALSDGRALVRRSRHGGLLRWLTGARFLGWSRVASEVVLAERLRELGLPTPEVLAARAERRGPFWRLELVSRRVEGGVDLAEALERLREGRIEERARRTLSTSLGALVARLHRSCFVHADLNPRNLLLDEDGLTRGAVRTWILDLGGSRFVAELDDGLRLANLRRLYRAVRRREARGRRFLRASDYARFLRGYERELAPRASGWRADWSAVEAADRRRRALHRLGWSLERLFGGDAARRDGRAVVRA